MTGVQTCALPICTSERDSNFSQHWTDGQGNYRASNDASFNPNVGAGGGANWQRMETR